MDYSFLNTNKIVPVVVLNTLQDTVPTLQGLYNGGIKVAEITFRTSCAPDAISLARKTFPDMMVGAGTVINEKQCVQAINAGATFIVSPGFSSSVNKVCNRKNIPYIPGAVTPTEIMAALEEGLTVLKFFPAQNFGGVKMLKALSAAFPQVSFVPTGGIDENNMKEFLLLPFVKAIGGSFMLKGTYEEIENKSRIAVGLTEGL
ncbi:MAG TPA: bifunctional 4-hydroxy-2-oxoglutarate aldolase/2-dehydro-3-deoxy-phosphogluconate aldolase [Clostridia bacterium]|nr:bifunctional 4-hydroxy-2-oxoglutarate aldolase/2-dehydro-3-deoxy-phosphogluconate aldolase [Clostridia bacterium]